MGDEPQCGEKLSRGGDEDNVTRRRYCSGIELREHLPGGVRPLAAAGLFSHLHEGLPEHADAIHIFGTPFEGELKSKEHRLGGLRQLAHERVAPGTPGMGKQQLQRIALRTGAPLKCGGKRCEVPAVNGQGLVDGEGIALHKLAFVTESEPSIDERFEPDREVRRSWRPIGELERLLRLDP